MRVFQLLEDKKQFRLKCPRCGREKIVPISEVIKTDEDVASEAQEEATSS